MGNVTVAEQSPFRGAFRDVYLGAFADKMQPRGTPERARHDAVVAARKQAVEASARRAAEAVARADARVRQLKEWGVLDAMATRPEFASVRGMLECGRQYGIDHEVIMALERAGAIWVSHNFDGAITWRKRKGEG
jgi:hypothetical protein